MICQLCFNDFVLSLGVKAEIIRNFFIDYNINETIIQRRNTIDSSTYFGKGKIKSIILSGGLMCVL